MRTEQKPFEYIDHTQINTVKNIPQQELPGLFTGFFFRIFGSATTAHDEVKSLIQLASENTFGPQRQEVANHIRLLGSKGIVDLTQRILKHYLNVKYGAQAKYIKEAQAEFILAYKYAREKRTQDDIKNAMEAIGISSSHIDTIIKNCTRRSYFGAISSFNLGGCCDVNPGESDNLQKLSLEKLLEKHKKLADTMERLVELGTGEIVSPSYKKSISEQEKEAVQSIVIRAKKVGEKFASITKEITKKLGEDSSHTTTIDKTVTTFEKAQGELLKLEKRAQ